MLGLSLLKAANSFKTFLITANTVDLNLFAVAGNPTVRGKFRYFIQPVVTVGQSGSSLAALVVGQFPSGSEIEIFNNGSILARGGIGGSQGGNLNGANGGDAIKTDYAGQTVRITNNGQIKAGGGGGGAGGNGGAGGEGNWGNIVSTTQWYWWEPDRSQWIEYRDGNKAGSIEAYITQLSVSANNQDTTNYRLVSGTELVVPNGLIQRGSSRGMFNENNGDGNYESFEVRFCYLESSAPAGTAGGRNGGNGAGYGQARGDGAAGYYNQGGANGAAGRGGDSGAAGGGGNGGDWASPGTAGGNGTNGQYGSNGGVYPVLPETRRNPQGGTGAGGPGATGRAVVKGAASVTYTDNGTTVGAVV